MSARPWPALDEHGGTHITYIFLILYLITISLFPRYQLSVKLMRGVCQFSDTHTVYVTLRLWAWLFRLVAAGPRSGHDPEEATIRHITLAIDR